MNDTSASFIALAREDLVVAKKLILDHPRHAAFQIEQAAKKLLKAVLSAEEISVSASHHQLGRLAELLPPDHIWRADLMAFDAYSTYATSSRYPLPGGGMPRTPAKAALADALKNVSSLVGAISDWCQEKADKPASKR
jgi:HEPN domain-containing protein